MRLLPGPHTFTLELLLPEGAGLAADAGTFEVTCASGGSVVMTPPVQPLEPLATFTVEVADGTSTLEVRGALRFVLDDQTHKRDFALEVAVVGASDGEAAPLPVTLAVR